MQEAEFILSKRKVLEQYNKIKNISDVVSYSSKTNPNVTKILEENTDSFFSIHMESELKNLRDFSRVLFLVQGINKEGIEDLIKRGIKKFIVDNEKDLMGIINFLKRSDYEIELFLRVKLKENTVKTEKYFVFGMNSELINKKIKEISEDEKLKGRISRLGVHFHRKTQNMAEWNLKEEFEEIISPENLKRIDVVDIGGGLPSEYANTNVNVINSIFRKIQEFKEFLNERKIKLLIEPGRFIAAPPVKLKTRIIRVYENNIIVNASLYNSDLDALIVPVKLKVEGELEKDSDGAKPYIIKGITPCSMDLFRYRVYLKNPKEGDELVFLNAGAYNFSSDFCDLKKIETKIVE